MHLVSDENIQESGRKMFLRKIESRFIQSVLYADFKLLILNWGCSPFYIGRCLQQCPPSEQMAVPNPRRTPERLDINLWWYVMGLFIGAILSILVKLA